MSDERGETRLTPEPRLTAGTGGISHSTGGPTHDDAESEAERVETWTIGHFMWRDKSRPETKCRGVLAGPEIPGDQIEVVPLTALTHERQRAEEAERERDAARKAADGLCDLFNEAQGKVETAERQLHEAPQLERCQEALRVARRALVLERDERMAAKRDAISTQTAIASVDSALSHPTSPNTKEV